MGYPGRVGSQVNPFLLRVKKIGFGSGIFRETRPMVNSDLRKEQHSLKFCHGGPTHGRERERERERERVILNKI